MATQTQSLNHNQGHFGNKKFVRCAMCSSKATRNHYVEAAGGILAVCDRCDFILELKDRIYELENELAEYKKEVN